MQIYVKETHHANEPGPTLVLVTVGAASPLLLAVLPKVQGFQHSSRPWGPSQHCDVYSLGPEPRPVRTQPGWKWVRRSPSPERDRCLVTCGEHRDRDINAPLGETCRALHKISFASGTVR